jgi:hypothetical protein
MKSIFPLMLLLFSAVASAEEVKIKWKGDYAHNSDKRWSKDNPYDSGFSKNFKNGTPQEFGDVQKDGELNGFVFSPKDRRGPVPFVVVMHGCDGMTTSEKEWTAHVADVLNKEGIGALVLDSYTRKRAQPGLAQRYEPDPRVDRGNDSTRDLQAKEPLGPRAGVRFLSRCAR